jgi:hypothetical protein
MLANGPVDVSGHHRTAGGGLTQQRLEDPPRIVLRLVLLDGGAEPSADAACAQST